jgi:hypothetical protein
MVKARSLVGPDVHAAKIVAAVLDGDTGELEVFVMKGENANAAGFCGSPVHLGVNGRRGCVESPAEGWVRGWVGPSRGLRTSVATRRRPSAAGCWMSEVQLPTKEGDVRVTTAFNRMLVLPGASVQDVAFGGEGVIVTVALRRRRRVCSGCGAEGLEIKDRRLGRWRHLDLGASRCVIECELRRLRCPGCGDRPEMVPWARAGSS